MIYLLSVRDVSNHTMKTVYKVRPDSITISRVKTFSDVRLINPPIPLSIIGDMKPISLFLPEPRSTIAFNVRTVPDFSILIDAIAVKCLLPKDCFKHSVLKISPCTMSYDIFMDMDDPHILNVPYYSTYRPDMSDWKITKHSDIDDMFNRLTPNGYLLTEEELVHKKSNGTKRNFHEYFKIKRIDITITGVIIVREEILYRYNINAIIIEPIYKIRLLKRIKSFFTTTPVNSSLSTTFSVNVPKDIVKKIALGNTDAIPSFLRLNKDMFSIIFNPENLQNMVMQFKEKGDFPYWFSRPIVIQPWMTFPHLKSIIDRTRTKCENLLSRMSISGEFMMTGPAILGAFYNMDMWNYTDVYMSMDNPFSKSKESEEPKKKGCIVPKEIINTNKSFVDTIARFDLSLFQIGYTSDHKLLISPSFLYTFFYRDNLLFMFTDSYKKKYYHGQKDYLSMVEKGDYDPWIDDGSYGVLDDMDISYENATEIKMMNVVRRHQSMADHPPGWSGKIAFRRYMNLSVSPHYPGTIMNVTS